MLRKFKNIITLTGCALIAFSAVRCSPNSASITKAALLGMEEKKPVGTRDKSNAATPLAQASLEAQALDSSTYNQQIKQLDADDTIVAFSLDPAQLTQFKSTDEGAITPPNGVNLNNFIKNGGVVYLFVDDLQDVRQMSSLLTLSVNIKPTDSDATQWEILTSNDKSVEQPLLSGLTQVVVTVRKAPVPVPSVSPSPAVMVDKIDGIISAP